MTGHTPRTGLRIERRFTVPPETVFRMLTDPAEMPTWWGDDARFEIDLRAGGRWTVVREENGTEYLATGEFLEVEPPTRLVYTFAMPEFSPNADTITVRITPVDDGSILVFEHTGPDIEGELQSVPPGETSATEAGWQQGFDLMVAAWSNATT